MIPFLIRCYVSASAGLLAACATAPEQSADWNSVTGHGFRQITPLQMPKPETAGVPVVTIPKFSFEGYDAVIAEEGGAAGAGTYFITELVPQLGGVLVGLRFADRHSEEVVTLNPRRKAARIFRGSFENFADNTPLLVIATRPDDDNGHNPVPITVDVFLLQPAQNRVSHFTEVRSWTTSGRYCWPGVALDRVMGITPPVPVEPANGCDPGVPP